VCLVEKQVSFCLQETTSISSELSEMLASDLAVMWGVLVALTLENRMAFEKKLLLEAVMADLLAELLDFWLGRLLVLMWAIL